MLYSSFTCHRFHLKSPFKLLSYSTLLLLIAKKEFLLIEILNRGWENLDDAEICLSEG